MTVAYADNLLRNRRGPLTTSALALVLFLAVGCRHTPGVAGAGSTDRRVPVGTWGGEHVALIVTETGAHLEFDCAFGDITQPLTFDRSGRLAVEGVFVQEHGGPVRLGEKPDRRPARYFGRLNGKTLTFEATLIDSNTSIGSFTLVSGATPRITKCR